ncbi:hypothetical protein OS493_021674 [Desmophyllum pertusum]|uniref:Uncharacterized protein n=1 Tax=Desmophyllum pertusum TaxID=174260 RepID=A0A9W9YB45_9CNID|nr:hypothetical protein OS493_021674 [Desmophyllum pertusum]
MLFCRGRGNPRKQDSRWSYVVCLCATLSQALIMGIAQGFGIFLPVSMDEFNTSREYTANFLITAKYFVKRRSLATGLVTAGAGLGIFALAPINQILIDAYGLSGAFRALGFVILANCFLALFYDPNIQEELAQGLTSQETLEIPDNNTTQDSQRCHKLIDFQCGKCLPLRCSCLLRWSIYCDIYTSVSFGTILRRLAYRGR